MEQRSNSVEYWAETFRDQHIKTVDGVLELGALFNECGGTAGPDVLKEATAAARYKPSAVSQFRQVALHVDSRFFNSIKAQLPSGWGTLYALTRLSDEEWDAALDNGAIHPGMTQAEAKKLRRPQFSPPLDVVPEGEYNLIYADPPWRYEHVKTESRAIENQYPTMDLEEICRLPIPAAEDCVLFLWATSPKLAEAMTVITAWGFNYRTCAVWVKDKIGMGYYFRQRHELLLLATKGEPGAPETSEREDSVISAPRQKHSAKPPELYDRIERMYPHSKRIELFARMNREGWAAWGNQA